ncbi:MAG TPA: hypothetical protein VKE70_04665 [Candidatus Solibacter sp.]|nr:hypothetical protein [Candidatus Solibacter sp.]
MNSMTTQQIREFVVREYIEPARRMRQRSVTVRAGDVHKKVKLKNRVPLVCQALSSKKFLTDNHLKLERLDGPKSGLSTTSAFTYRLDDQPDETASKHPISFVDIIGIGKEVFQKLGGGEAFIRKERRAFRGIEQR